MRKVVPWTTAPLTLALLLTAAISVSAQALDVSQFRTFEDRLVESITFEGHKATKEFVIERELATEEGEPFDFDTLVQDVVRLENLNIFASIEVTPEAAGDEVALTFTFKEMPPFIPFIAFTYTEENGFSVGPALSSLNLFGRDMQVSFRALFGGTNTFSLKASYPWITGDHVSAELNAFNLKRTDEIRGFDEDSLELTPWIGTYLGEHGRLYGTVSYFQMKSDKDGITIQEDNVDNLLRLGVRLGWDTRDSWRNPRLGWQNEFELWRTGGFLGGDGDFWTFTFDVRRFHPIKERSSLAGGLLTTLQTGEPGVDVPSYMQYGLGGANSVRGHNVNELSKRLFGKNQFLGTLEYRYQVMPIRRFDIWKFSFSIGAELAAFADVGLAWNEPQEYAWNRFAKGGGVGVRLLVPGSEQTRLDVGYSREGGWQFHFGNWSKFTAQRLRVR